MSVLADATLRVSQGGLDSPDTTYLRLEGELVDRQSAVNNGGRGIHRPIIGQVTFLPGEPAQLGVCFSVGTMRAEGCLVISGGDIERFAALIGTPLQMAHFGS
jgi:hypothetical protein